MEVLPVRFQQQIYRRYGCFRKQDYPQIIHFNKVSIINHPFWGPTPIFGNTHMKNTYFPKKASVKLLISTLQGGLDTVSGVWMSSLDSEQDKISMVQQSVTLSNWPNSWYKT